MRASAREIETLNERALLYKDKIIERSARPRAVLRRAPTGVYVSRRQLSDREVTFPKQTGQSAPETDPLIDSLPVRASLYQSPSYPESQLTFTFGQNHKSDSSFLRRFATRRSVATKALHRRYRHGACQATLATRV